MRSLRRFGDVPITKTVEKQRLAMETSPLRRERREKWFLIDEVFSKAVLQRA